jgi:MGT family glycosyltransferase
VSSIFFVEMPAFGHVNPSLPLVRELVRRGERVVYYNDAEFQPMLESSGASFRAYPRGVLTSEYIAGATQTGDLVRVPRLILQATHTLVPFLLESLRRDRPDAIVLDSNALWGHIAARTLRVSSVSLLTTILLGSTEYGVLRPREWMHALRPMLGSLVPVLRARSQILRRFGPSVPRPAFPALGGLNLGLFPHELQRPDSRIDGTFRWVGPLVDPDSAGSAAFEPPAGEGPLVYLSLGTLHRAPADFLRQCLDAFSAIPMRLIVSTGSGVDIQALGRIPANCRVSSFVPQLAVLQHAALFISHGGMNSVLESLACGVPLLVIPQQVEQLVIGLTLAERGAALVRREHLAGRPVEVAGLVHDVFELLERPRFRSVASEMQTRLRACGGVREAADEVQAYIARQTRVTC